MLGLITASSAIDAGVQNMIYGKETTTLAISNEEMNDIMVIIQALQDPNILLKGVTQTIKNETKEQKKGFLSMLLGTLGTSLLGNLLTGKGTIRAGEGAIRAGYGSSSKKKALIPPHLLSNFERKDYYENEPRLNGVYSRDNLPNKTKHGAYIVNLDQYSDIGTHWTALHVKDNEITYFQF